MISCYALISKSPVSTPVATGRMHNVPYYQGYRYVAFPTRTTEEVCILDCNVKSNLIIFQAGRVDLYEERPASLVYFEHCFHILDVKKVFYSYTWSTSICSYFLQMCNCPDISFGTVETLSSCIHGQASQARAGESFHIASKGEKVNEMFLCINIILITSRSSMRLGGQALLRETHLPILRWVILPCLNERYNSCV